MKTIIVDNKGKKYDFTIEENKVTLQKESIDKGIEYVDVCISNEEDAKDVFGIEAEDTDIYGGKLNHEGYKSVAKQLADKFSFEMIAIHLEFQY